MIRTILAVAIAVALIGVSLPAIDHAASVRSDERVQGEIAGIDRAVSSMLANDERSSITATGPRRIVTVSLPARSMTRAAVDYVVVDGTSAGAGDDAIAYRLDGGSERTIHLDVPVRTAGDPIVLRDSGDHRLRLTLRETEDGPVAVVDRPRV